MSQNPYKSPTTPDGMRPADETVEEMQSPSNHHWPTAPDLFGMLFIIAGIVMLRRGRDIVQFAYPLGSDSD